MSRKTLGPPKGLEATGMVARQAAMAQRLTPAAQTPPPEDEAPTPVAEAGTPASYTPPTRVRKTRPEPPGMTRRTYYLPQAAAEALEAAVASIQEATGGRVPKHEILAALITAGTARADAVTGELKAALLRELNS